MGTKLKILTVIAAVALGVLAAGPYGGALWSVRTARAVAAAPADAVKAPRIVLPESRYKFAPTMEGTEIKHDFVVENQGNAPLVIYRVQPD